MCWIGDNGEFVAFLSCNYTRIMSYTRARVLSILGLLTGGAGLVYVLVNQSPYSESGQLNPVAVLAVLTGVFLTSSGASALLALSLHRRWPALAGRQSHRRRQAPTAEPALRQGILAGLAAVTLLALAILRVLDVAVLIVTLLVAGLIEAFVQSRQ